MARSENRRRIAILTASIALAALAPMTAAIACDQPGPAPLPDVLDSWEQLGITPLGVFEAEVIAASPSLIVRGERAASLVVRTWGVAPSDTGIHIDRGAGINLGTCDDALPPTGEIQHGVVTTSNQHRSLNGSALFLLDNGSLSSADEALLVRTFGAPEIYEVTLAGRVWANWLVWWPVAAAVLVGLVAFRWMMPNRRSGPGLGWAWRALKRHLGLRPNRTGHDTDASA